MAEDGCINSAIFQNLDILGKVEFKDVEFTGNSKIGTHPTSDILTINSRIRMPIEDDVEATMGTRVLVRDNENKTLHFEPKAERVFKTIAVDNQPDIIASSLTDTLRLKPGTNMTIETETINNNKFITFSSSVGSNVQNIYKTIRVDNHTDLIPNTSVDVLKFQGGPNISISSKNEDLDVDNTWRAELSFDGSFYSDSNIYGDNGNNNQEIKLYDATNSTYVSFRMVADNITPTNFMDGSVPVRQYKKGSNLSVLVDNLSQAINNYSQFSSVVTHIDSKIIVTQQYSGNNVVSNNNETIQGISILTNFTKLPQDMSTITIGLKDNKIEDDLVIGDSSTDLLLVNSNSTFINKTIFNNNVSIGTTNSNSVNKLDVDGSINITTGNEFKLNNSTILSETDLGTTITNSSLTSVGILDGGSITSNFGNIDIGTSNLTSGNLVTNNILESYDGNNIEYVVTVQNATAAHPYRSAGSSVYYIDGIESPFIEFVPGKTYKFDQSDSSNGGHPLRFYYDKDKNNAYDDINFVTPNGTPGSPGAYTQIVVNVDTPRTLFYMCSQHNNMGNQVQVKGGNIVNTGALDGGSITSNFGNINNGSSSITTTGNISGGTLTGTLSTVAQPNITSVGALDVGSITSNFGDIDIGTSTLDCGNITSNGNLQIDGTFTNGIYTFDTSGNLSNLGKLNCREITTNGDIEINGTITAYTSLTLDSTTITSSQLNILSGNTFGTASPNKPLILDSNKDIGTLRNLIVDGNIGSSSAELIGTISPITPLQPNIISVGTLASLDISGDLSVNTNVLKVDTTNNRVGINKTTPSVDLDVNGHIKSTNLTVSNIGGTSSNTSSNSDKLTFIDGGGVFSSLTNPTSGEGVLIYSADNSKIEWTSFSTITEADFDKSIITNILSSPIETDYFVGSDENDLFFSSGNSRFLEDVSIVDSILRLDNSSGNSISLEGSSSISLNPTIKSSNGKIDIVSDNTSATILNINNATTGNSVIGFQLSGTNKFTIGVDDDDADKFKIGTTTINTNTRLTIDSSGNVGIGTTNPTKKLEVYPDTSCSAIIGKAHIGHLNISTFDDFAGFSHIDKADATNFALLQKDDGETILNCSAGKNIKFQVNNSDKMRIDSAGNVGIGETSPDEKLHINNGNIKFIKGDYVPAAGAPEAAGQKISFHYGGNPNEQLNPDCVIQSYSYGNNNVYSGGIGIFTKHNNTASERMRIDPAGNVGIGTTNPTKKLEVYPDTDCSAIIGKAHIGHLNISTFDDFAGFSHIDKANATNFALVQKDDGETILNCSAGKNIKFQVNNTDKMRIDSAGNVGIGVTNPSNKLEVNGNIDLGSTTTNKNKFIGYGTIPIGGIIMWNGENPPTAPDDGWALCNGQTVTYTENGVTLTLTTPDLRGRFIMSSTYNEEIPLDNDDENTNENTPIYEVQQKDGEQQVTLTTDEMPTHTHSGSTTTNGNHSHSWQHAITDRGGHRGDRILRSDRAYDGTIEGHTQTAGNHNHSVQLNTTGGSESHENRPPYYVLAYIMRVY